MSETPNSFPKESPDEQEIDEQTEPENSPVVQDISENSYYYDDGYGYKLYDPNEDYEDDDDSIN